MKNTVAWTGTAILLACTLAVDGQELADGDPRDHGVKPRQIKELRRELQTAADSQDVKGVALLVAHNGEVLFKEAFGKMTVDQRVGIASATKPLVATAFLLAAQQELFSLDDAVADHLPRFAKVTLEDGSPPKSAPTIAQILAHGSGITGQGLKDLAAEIGEFAVATRATFAQVVERMAGDKLAFEPGSGFYYGTAYDLIARIIEVETDTPFDVYLQQELLKPLGLDATDFFPPTKLPQPDRPKLSAGRFVSTAGGLVSTLDDLAVFLEFHRTGARGGESSLLSSESLSAMHVVWNQVGDQMAEAFGDRYGYGWFLERLDDPGTPRTSSHAGRSGSMIWIDWDLDLIGVFLAPNVNVFQLLPLIRASQGRVRGWFE